MPKTLTYICCALVIFGISCRKKESTLPDNKAVINDTVYVDTIGISNSTYKDATITFNLYRSTERDSISIHSNSYRYQVSAHFSVTDGYEPLKVYLNSLQLVYAFNPHDPNFGKFSNEGGIDVDALQGYYSNTLAVYSPNGTTDLHYIWRAIPVLNDSIPYEINGHVPYTISINDADFPEADSLRIFIQQEYSIDTTVSVHCGAVTFSPSRLSVLYPAYPTQTGSIYLQAIRHCIVKYKDKTFYFTKSSSMWTDIKVVF